ncbi:MAG: hypothetical protein ACM3NF_02915 [Gemmatimonadota bacterium]
MPTSWPICRVCGAAHSPSPAGAASGGVGGIACPYGGAAYARLRAGHDQLYFGRWRSLDATRRDIRMARDGLERLLRAIGAVLAAEDLPVARRDLEKAYEALYSADAGEAGPGDLVFLDHALSYAHRVIGDLLHEKGLAPHSPSDFAGWYDAGDVPFREDW